MSGAQKIENKKIIRTTAFVALWVISCLLLRIPFGLSIGLSVIVALLLTVNLFPRIVTALVGIFAIWAFSAALTELPNYSELTSGDYEVDQLKSEAIEAIDKIATLSQKENCFSGLTLSERLVQLDQAHESNAISVEEYDTLKAELFSNFAESSEP